MRFPFRSIPFRLNGNGNGFCVLENGEWCSMKRELNGNGMVLPRCMGMVHACAQSTLSQYKPGHSVARQIAAAGWQYEV